MQAKSNYGQLVKRLRPRAAPRKTVEDQLDAMLKIHDEKKLGSADRGAPAVKADPLALLRDQMRAELIPAFNELRDKYAERKLMLSLDVDDFLNGGRHVGIHITFEGHGMRLEGTVTDEGIAFHEKRYTRNLRGGLTSGPMLRSRGLDAQRFREFICERIALLVRSVARGQLG